MLCQNCGKNEATTHVKRIVNGETAEVHLCQACAAKLGYGSFFGSFGLNLGDFFGNLLGDAAAPTLESPVAVRCEKCGSTFRDILQSGKVGCADCYRTFYSQLLPSLQRIHGKTRHVGKVANLAGPRARAASRLEALRTELNEVVQAQNYERAAEIRDEIKQLESEASGNA